MLRRSAWLSCVCKQLPVGVHFRPYASGSDGCVLLLLWGIEEPFHFGVSWAGLPLRMPSRVQRLLLLHGGGPTALWVLTAHACALQRPLPPVPPDEPPFNTLYPEVGDPMTVSHCVAVPIGAVL